MADKKQYWRGITELENPGLKEELGKNEFREPLPTDEFLSDENALQNGQTTRRDFLKYMGFTTAAATLAACESPVYESVPYVVAPEEVIPGLANYYATSYYDGYDYAALLIKTREGRPIKVENNKMAKLNGSANARLQGSVLNLYDSARLQAPQKGSKSINWETLDAQVIDGLKKADGQGKQVVLLTGTVISPSAQRLIRDFGKQYKQFRHVVVDPFSYSEKLRAWQEATGKRALPLYHFDKARVIVSFGADFLGDWIGQNVSADYAKTRIPGKDMSRHLQFEANLSLTGSNADQRYKLKSAETGLALAELYNAIAQAKGKPTLSLKGKSSQQQAVQKAAQELLKAGSKALVVAGGNNAEWEHLVIAINKLLGVEGHTVNVKQRSYLRQGSDRALENLTADMKAGKVGGVIVHNANPAYHRAGSLAFNEALKKVNTKVAISSKPNETAQACDFMAAENHYLESWNDFKPADGHYSLQQPTIRRVYDTRQFEECLMSWMGASGSYQERIKNSWQQGMLRDRSWQEVLHDGIFAVATPLASAQDAPADKETAQEPQQGGANLNRVATAVSKMAQNASGMEINLYQKAGIGAGLLANNPWLQELPDPITRTTWDNYVSISAADANEMGLRNWNESDGALNGNAVNLKVGDTELKEVPIIVQPGQTPGTIGLAIGYGREGLGKVADGVGVNAQQLALGSGHFASVKVSPLPEYTHHFASIQHGSTMMGREIVKETDLHTFLTKPAHTEAGTGWNELPEFGTYKGEKAPDKTTLWSSFDHETGHMWNMSIDLNLCTGCGACVVACQSENNVPAVGKEEVRNFRDMHWLRIDRYYSSEVTEEMADDLSTAELYDRMEKAADSPSVYFQPVMCQHCNHAPCETVCPVAATTHSAEGLNHMAYNRCIGTRYCANNCPYKVRRFNWFEYHNNQERFDVNYSMNDDMGKMVLNPDVTVRSRGVMEKCSMCIQRIQLGKLEAKKNGVMVKDGQIQTACQSACDTGAIVFGDVNDKESKVFELKGDDRMYHLLGEVGTQPSVFYQVKVTNKA